MAQEIHSHTDNSSKTSYTSAFWFVLILAGLFIGVINFVNVMGHDEGEAHDATHDINTEQATQHHSGSSAVDSSHTEGH